MSEETLWKSTVTTELSKKGQLFLLIPAFLLLIGILLRQPYTVVAGTALFSLIFYSKWTLDDAKIDIETEILGKTLYVDETFQISHRISTSGPVRAELSPNLTEELRAKDNPCLNGPISSESILRYRAVPSSRGHYEVGRLDGYIEDVLGLFSRHVEMPIGKTITVHSSKEAIKKAKTYSRRKHAETFVESPMQFTRRTNEFSNIRRYQPGDSLKNIHWKSFSRFQELMTIEYEKISPIGCHVLLDCSPSMRRRLPSGTTKLEQAIFVSLEILKNFELLGHQIGLTAYDHKKVIFHRPLELERSTFRRIYDEVTELPGAVQTAELSVRRYDFNMERQPQDKHGRAFMEKIGKLMGKRGWIPSILSAVTQLETRESTEKIVILISDLETQPRATLEAVQRLRRLDNEVWTVVPFSPWYEATELDKETLERAYEDYENLETMVEKLRRMKSSVFELHPGKEGLMILEEWSGMR